MDVTTTPIVTTSEPKKVSRSMCLQSQYFQLSKIAQEKGNPDMAV